jgi:hypothetical protein
MASGGKKKTTMAKLNRERKLQERRMDKAARKDARKYAASQPDLPAEEPTGDDVVSVAPEDSVLSADEQRARAAGMPVFADA